MTSVHSSAAAVSRAWVVEFIVMGVLPSPQPIEQLFILANPLAEGPDARPHSDGRLPVQPLAGLAQVAHEHRLVARPPIIPTKGYLDTQLLLEISQQFEQRHRIGGPTADVECLARREAVVGRCSFIG